MEKDCPFAPDYENSPFKRLRPPGYHTVGSDQTCNYCGSWHADEFIAWCQQILNKEIPCLREGGRWGVLELNDHRDKLYVHRPNIKNANEGAIKVYIAHLSTQQVAIVNDVLARIHEALTTNDPSEFIH